ncbi:MAG: MFS transporter [Roseibium sp.]
MTKPFISSCLAETQNSPTNILNLTAAGLAIVASTYGLARYCFGLFLPEIRLEFQFTSETIGLIAGMSYVGYLFATFAGSWLSTVFGPRLPILLGGLAAVGGMATIGLSTTPQILAFGVFIAGMSPGLAYPPFSDIVVHNVPLKRQNGVYSWINSGTGFGVAFAGPLALYAGEDWRLSWLIFSALALIFTFWNMTTLPRRNLSRRNIQTFPFTYILQRSALPLFVAAFLFGIVTAIYWTFAVELLWNLTGNSRDTVFFWIVLGVAGVTGCFAGGIVNQWGLRRSYFMLLLFVGCAIASLPSLVQIPFGIFLSAACFGSGFIVTTALFGIWSMRIFREAPSLGFGTTFFLISLGQGVGPVIGGFLAPVIGFPMIFVGAGLMCLFLTLFQPGTSEASAA